MEYNRTALDWNRKLEVSIKETLKRVLDRLDVPDLQCSNEESQEESIRKLIGCECEAKITAVYYNPRRGDYFYRIEKPLSIVGLVPGESHWLADWGQAIPSCKVGDIVRFKVKKIDDKIRNWDHVKTARNIDFMQLEVM